MASSGDINVDNIMPTPPKRWIKLAFSDAIDKNKGSFVKLTKKSVLETGVFPVIDQGESFLSGYVDDVNLTYKGKTPVIIFGDHTRVVKYIDFQFAVGADGTKILTPKPFYSPKFFFFYLKSLMIPNLGYSRHFKILKQVKIPLPPLAEQKRIVAKLDGLLGHIERSKERLAKVPELLKTFRQSVLAQAVSGVLTEDWRAEHPDVEGKDLLISIKEKRIEKGNKKLIPNLFPNRSIYGEIPKKWELTTFDSIIREIKAGKSFKCEERSPKKNEVGVLKVSAISWNIYQEAESKTCFDTSRVNPQLYVKQGDFLISRANTIELVGAVVIAERVTKNIMLSDKTLRIELIDIDKYWCLYNLRSKYGREQIEKYATGAQESMRNIGQNKIRKITIPIPPLEEQKEIVKRVEALLAKADAIEAQYQAAVAHLETLPQAILAKAFRGELVEQDPNDEPATVLLERIQAKQEQLKASKKKSGKKKKGATQKKK